MQYYGSDSDSDNEIPVGHYLNYKIKDYYKEPYLVLWCSDEKKMTVNLDDLIQYHIRKNTTIIEDDFKTVKFKLERMIKIKENELTIEKDKKNKQKNFKRIFRDYTKVNIWEHLPKVQDLDDLPDIDDDIIGINDQKSKTNIKYNKKVSFANKKKDSNILCTGSHNNIDLIADDFKNKEKEVITQITTEPTQSNELPCNIEGNNDINLVQKSQTFPKEYENITWFKIKIDTPIQLYLLKINADLTNFQYSEEMFIKLPVAIKRSVFQLLSEICTFIGRSNNMAVLNKMSKQVHQQEEPIVQSQHKFYVKFQETYMKVLEYTFDELSLEQPQAMNLLLSFQSSIVTTKYSKRFTVSNIMTFVKQQMKMKNKALKSILIYEKEKQQRCDYDQFNYFDDD